MTQGIHNKESNIIKLKHILLLLLIIVLFFNIIMIFQLNGRDSQIIKMIREECTSKFELQFEK